MADPSGLKKADAAIAQGLKIARDCGYGLFHIDLLLERARLHLLRGNPQSALEDIQLALDDGIPANDETGQPELLAADHEECGYAWAIPAGLHLRGEAQLLAAAQQIDSDSFVPAKRDELLGDVQALIESAKSNLNEALAKWQPLHDPEPEREDQNFKHPETGDEYNFRAAETWQVLQDLGGGVLTRYPLRATVPVESTTTKRPEQTEGAAMKDFFISYNSNDVQWAEWIAFKLEEAGYETVIQAWDFRAGGDFVMEMQKAAVGTKKTIAVLSDNYLNAEFTQPEWGNAFARDPQGNDRTLVPVRIAKCKPPGLLATRIYIDLVGLSEDEGREKLIESLKERGKPESSPEFPGSKADESETPPTTATRRAFPGQASTAVEVWREKLEFLQAQEPLLTTPDQKFALTKQIEEAERKIAELSVNP